MKTAKEILMNYDGVLDFNEVNNIAYDESATIKAMEEYADQFKPKWIPCEPEHEINTGRIFVLYEDGYIRSDRVLGEFSSINIDLESIKATHYCKIELPEKP